MPQNADMLDGLKTRVKNLLGSSYPLLVKVIGPVMPRLGISWKGVQSVITRTVRNLCVPGSTVIQLGSGPFRLHPSIINVDIRPFPGVDVVADALRLPFETASVDGIIHAFVLEHVEDPDLLIREACRVLKPGGAMVASVPFLQPFHGSPGDFQRWTRSGLHSLLERHGLTRIKIQVEGGPTSALLWVLQEWLALVCSLGSRHLHAAWLIFFTIVLSPVKVFDLLLVYHPESHRAGASFLSVACKPAAETLKSAITGHR